MRRSSHRPDPERSYIRALICDWNDELHGGADQRRPNIGRIDGAWRRSRLGADAFVGIMYEAYRRAKYCQRIERRADGPLGELGARNRMPYFFAILERLAIDASL